MAAPGKITLTLALLLLTACNEQQPPADLKATTELLAQAAPSEPVDYKCADGSRIQSQHEPQHGRMVLYMTDRAVQLEQVPSDSGTKFEADGIVFRNKGDTAIVQRAGGTETECRRIEQNR